MENGWGRDWNVRPLQRSRPEIVMAVIEGGGRDETVCPDPITFRKEYPITYGSTILE